MIEEWVNNAEGIAVAESLDEDILITFIATMRWLNAVQLQGACHNVSAALFILMNEQGINAELCIGEINNIKSNFRLDHSWLEIDKRIYDVTLFMPLPTSIPFPPVFGSIDLSTNKTTDFKYSGTKESDLDKSAKFVYDMSLSEYVKAQGDMPEEYKLWNLTANLAQNIGIKIDLNKVKDKYGNIKRTLK